MNNLVHLTGRGWRRERLRDVLVQRQAQPGSSILLPSRTQTASTFPLLWPNVVTHSALGKKKQQQKTPDARKQHKMGSGQWKGRIIVMYFHAKKKAFFPLFHWLWAAPEGQKAILVLDSQPYGICFQSSGSIRNPPKSWG